MRNVRVRNSEIIYKETIRSIPESEISGIEGCNRLFGYSRYIEGLKKIAQPILEGDFILVPTLQRKRNGDISYGIKEYLVVDQDTLLDPYEIINKKRNPEVILQDIHWYHKANPTLTKEED